MDKNILQHAVEILYDRAEEKERQYGPFEESMRKAATIASLTTRKAVSTEDMYKNMIALKLSRLAYSNKYDTYLDLIVYTAALWEYYSKSNIKNS